MLDLSSATPHTSMRERVAHVLRTAILNGELIAGQRITETEIADQLGTSRAPVREAIRSLVTEGFLETEAYRETRVARITVEELRDVLVPIRIVTETFALRQMMLESDKAVFAELEATVESMKRALAVNDCRRIIDEDLVFHKLLVQSAPYSHPARIWFSITPVIYRAFVAGTTDQTALDTVEGHVHLLDVMRGGDVDAAVAYLTEHIREMELRFPDTPDLDVAASERTG